MLYQIFFTKQAQKDVAELPPKIRDKLKKLLTDVVSQDPFCGKNFLGLGRLESVFHFPHRGENRNRIEARARRGGRNACLNFFTVPTQERIGLSFFFHRRRHG